MGSLHQVAGDRTHTVWDNAIDPVLEVESGATVELVFPLLGIAFIGFTIYKNVAGTAAPYDRFPWIVLAWRAIVAAAPGVVRRIGVALTRQVG